MRRYFCDIEGEEIRALVIGLSSLDLRLTLLIIFLFLSWWLAIRCIFSSIQAHRGYTWAQYSYNEDLSGYVTKKFPTHSYYPSNTPESKSY